MKKYYHAETGEAADKFNVRFNLLYTVRRLLSTQTIVLLLLLR